MKWLVRFTLALALAISLSSTLVAAQELDFTIQADEALRPAVTALFEARYAAAPTFVETDADLLASADPSAIPAGFAGLPLHFLPDGFFILNTDNAEAAEFAAFAVSPDGQQALIDAGLLPASVTILDQAGNVVELPQPVRRVVSPYSLSTYLIYGVGAADRLVAAGFLGARDPIGAARMEAIDPRFPELSGYVMNQREINTEEIAILAPDVIFTGARSAWLDTVAELQIPVVLFQGESPELLAEAMRISGQVFGPHSAALAEAWVDYYERIFAQVIERTSDITPEERPRVLFVGTEPLRVISGDMYQTHIIAAAGGQSVSAALTGSWNDVNLEQVVLWDPQVIIIAPYGVPLEAITDSPEWQVVPAVQAGQVYKMPSWVAPWDAPVPDSVLGIIWLASTLFPERVDLDCAAEAIYFFDTFYGHAIPADEIAAVCAS
ncbi:MAG: ABC transporter substrate-binding protein [Aggregatilineales bacterium]